MTSLKKIKINTSSGQTKIDNGSGQHIPAVCGIFKRSDWYISKLHWLNLYPSDLILSILVTIFYDYLSSDQILSAVVTVFVQSLIV